MAKIGSKTNTSVRVGIDQDCGFLFFAKYNMASLQLVIPEN